jgi:hypothetical protein
MEGSCPNDASGPITLQTAVRADSSPEKRFRPDTLLHGCMDIHQGSKALGIIWPGKEGDGRAPEHARHALPLILPPYTGLTADCDDIDPCARHRHTSRCSYALIYGSEARQADDYKSALW